MIVDPDPKTLCDPRLRAIHSYWQGKGCPTRLPGRPDIDPLELRRFLPRLMLVDVNPGPDFVYRLVGTGIVQDRGLEPTGRRVPEIFSPDLVETALEPYRLTHRHGRPVLDEEGWPTRRPSTTPDATLFLPLARDGRQVDMVMVYTVRPTRLQRCAS